MHKIKPKRDVQEEETNSRTKKPDGKNGGRGKGITKFSTDNLSDGVSSHENCVHLRQNQSTVTSFALELLLYSGVTFSREMGHEIPTECYKKGPPV